MQHLETPCTITLRFLDPQLAGLRDIVRGVVAEMLHSALRLTEEELPIVIADPPPDFTPPPPGTSPTHISMPWLSQQTLLVRHRAGAFDRPLDLAEILFIPQRMAWFPVSSRAPYGTQFPAGGLWPAPTTPRFWEDPFIGGTSNELGFSVVSSAYAEPLFSRLRPVAQARLLGVVAAHEFTHTARMDGVHCPFEYRAGEDASTPRRCLAAAGEMEPEHIYLWTESLYLRKDTALCLPCCAQILDRRQLERLRAFRA